MIANRPLRIASVATTMWLMIFGAVPAAQAQKQRPPTPAAAPASRTPMIKYFCFSTDPGQPAVYLSAVFDRPDGGSKADNFLVYERAKLGFQIYLAQTYSYSTADDVVECNYSNAATTAAAVANAAAAMATKKQSVTAEAVAAKKRVVETGWKFTGTPGVVAATAAPGPPGGRQVAPQPAPSQAASNDAGPLFQWHMDQTTDALTQEVSSQPAAMKIINGANGKVEGLVSVRVYCSSNGVSVFFLADAGDKDPKPSFPWYNDDSRGDDEQITDVRLVVDNHPVHVAQGFPEVDGHQQYTNTLGLLFYEPHTAERAVHDQENRVVTGMPAVDGLLGGIVKQSAESNVQAWQSSAAGPLSDLVDARSIRIELPVTTFDPKPVLDLNPQDPVLHAFVNQCSAKFTH